MAVRRDRIRTAIIGTGGIARQHVRRLIDSGELGRPLVAVCNTLWYRDNAYYAVPWRGTWQSELGGVSMGHGIHIMDLLLYLCGDWSEDPWPYPPTLERNMKSKTCRWPCCASTMAPCVAHQQLSLATPGKLPAPGLLAPDRGAHHPVRLQQ